MDEKWEVYSDWAVKGKDLQEKLLKLVDEDTDAFNRIMEAFALPKISKEDQAARTMAIRAATVSAIKVPLEVMITAFKGFELIEAMVETGNPNSVSDAGVGALAIRTCILGAHLNVLINMDGLEMDDDLLDIKKRADQLAEQAVNKEKELLGKVISTIRN